MMVFEQLVNDAKYEVPQKNLIYQVTEFKKAMLKLKKLILEEFSKLNLESFTKRYAEVAYDNLTKAINTLDCKYNYDLEKLLTCIKNNVVPFLKTDLLFQLYENKFQVSKYANNLMNLESDYDTTPPDLKQIVSSCIEHYKMCIINDKKENAVKLLSKEMAKNKTILKSYISLGKKNLVLSLRMTDKNSLEIKIVNNYNREIDKLKNQFDKLQGSKRHLSRLGDKIWDLENKRKLHIEKRDQYAKIQANYDAKLKEILSERELFYDKQNQLVKDQRNVIKQKAMNKKMYREMKQFYKNMDHYKDPSKTK